MGSFKVIIDDEIEKRFRRVAIKKHGHGKGVLNEAAEVALDEWSGKEDLNITLPSAIEQDPVGAIEGLLKRVRVKSVELQHYASRLR